MGGLKNISRIVLVVVLLLTSVFGYYVSTVKFDYDFESFFPVDDPETEFFEKHRKRFETDNDFVFIAFRNQPSVFEQDFLNKVSAFVDTMRTDSLVENVQSLTHLEDYIKTPVSSAVFSRPYLHINEPELFEKDSSLILSRPELVGYFINKKADALMVTIKHREHLSKAKCDTLKSTIDDRIEYYGLSDFKYAGRAIGINYYVDQMQNETVIFIGLSFLLVIVFLIFTFKSFWGVWVPLTIVTFSMIWIVGYMGIVGQPITLILTVLPSIIFVVAMSDVIHLVSKFIDELRYGRTKEEAIRIAYREVGFATLLTSITTAIGFLTLLTVNMVPVQTFGIYISIGVMFAFILAYSLLPSILVLVNPPRITSVHVIRNVWYRILHRWFMFVTKRRMAIFWSFIAVFIIGSIGLYKVEANYFLLEDLKPESSLRKDYDYFDKEFMGLRPFELAVKVVDSTKEITDYKVLKEMSKVENYLKDEYGLRHTFSIASVVKMANRTEHGGQGDYYKLPDDKETQKLLNRVQRFDKDGNLSVLIDSTGTYGRITSNMGDIGLYAIDDKNEDFREFLADETDTNLVKFRLTGTGHLLDRNMSSLAKKLTLGLLIAVLAVSLLMGLLYRSVKMVLIALIPNIFPMVMLAAILGYSGVNLTVSTAIIFTISFGIAVDDTIHFMSKFKLELNKGRSVLYALKRTYLSTGRAIVLTTLILCSGFLLLMLSDFLGTFYIGFLISATLVFALVADLLFLPVLLLFFYRRKVVGRR